MFKNIILSIIVLFISTNLYSQSVGLNIGDKAPEIKLDDPNGKPIALSSLQGKVVLIDFWGTWCAPCVKEQSELAKLFAKYRNSEFTCGKGFEIYGVSLDNKKKAWVNAIKKLKIGWVQVSDLLFWTSPVAKEYGIQELPFNVLIDGNGIILAKNLHGTELEQAIEKILKK